MTKWHGGKGSNPRPVDKEAYSTNWDRIFNNKNNKDNKEEENKNKNKIKGP